MTTRINRLSVAGLLCVVLAAGAARAQGDPPAQVGRLSEVDGVVSFHTADQAQWSPAVINYPVPAGSSFWTEPSARAALELGPAIIRLASQTEFDVVVLDDHNFQGQIGQGAVNLHLFALSSGDGFQIVTARGTVQITAPGHYHIDGGSGATPTLVTVFDGAAEFVGINTNLAIHPSETAAISGDPAASLTYDVAGAQPGPLDQWATARETQLQIAAQPQYVSAEMTGYQDLESNGSWNQTSSDGPVWYPANMPQDWAPYRDGHWAYVAPWGWTWIDDAAWGFAPFHYGRWARVDDRWGWYPGAVVQQPVYAPALVAFIGGPPGPGGLAIGISIGAVAAAVAWIPLGPHEAYDPPYRHSPAYLHNVNITNVTNFTTITNNRTVNNYVNRSAVTVVPAAAMVGSQPIAHAAVAVPAAQLAARPIAAAPPSVRPTLATAGATPAAVHAAGGPAGPAAHQRPAAPGPLAAPGHPATAVALTRVAPPPAGTHAAPPHVVAASATAPANAPASAVGAPAARPGTSPAPAAHAAAAPPPAAETPGKPPVAAPPHGVPVAAAPRPAEVAPHPAAPPIPAAAAAPHPAEVAPHPAAPPIPAAAAAPHPAEVAPHPAAPPVPAAAPRPAEVEPHPAAPPVPAAAPHPAEIAPPHPTPVALPPAAVHEAPAPHPAPPPHPAPEAAAHPAPPPHPEPAEHAAPPPKHPEPEKKEEHKE